MPSTSESRGDLRRERIRTAIRSLPVFKGLSSQDQGRLDLVARIRDLRKGETVWQAGDPSDALHVIISGRIKVVRSGASGDVILDLFGPGEQVGSVAVYADIPFPASAIAMEPSALLLLPRSEFIALLEEQPGFALGIIRELTRLNMALTRKLAEMRGQRVETRIARLFLMLADRMGRPTPAGLEIPIGLTRLEIAELVGTTVESSIRVMSRWGREELLITGEGRFVIPDRGALERVTGDDDLATQGF